MSSQFYPNPHKTLNALYYQDSYLRKHMFEFFIIGFLITSLVFGVYNNFRIVSAKLVKNSQSCRLGKHSSHNKVLKTITIKLQFRRKNF